VELGEDKEKLDSFFRSDGAEGYTDEKVAKHLGFPFVPGDPASLAPVTDVLEWYARLELGEQILKCVEEKGSCEFEAEV